MDRAPDKLMWGGRKEKMSATLTPYGGPPATIASDACKRLQTVEQKDGRWRVKKTILKERGTKKNTLGSP